MLTTLLTSSEVDAILRYRPGRARRLAKAGQLPSVVLPDGEIRFREADIAALLEPAGANAGRPASEGRR